jgi:hypothetical protein
MRAQHFERLMLLLRLPCHSAETVCLCSLIAQLLRLAFRVSFHFQVVVSRCYNDSATVDVGRLKHFRFGAL